jgi:hypothetical protein
MAKKPSPPPHFAPLQRVKGEPITDPAEQAAIDELRRRHRRADSPVRTGGRVRKASEAPADGALDLCRQLPAEDMLPLLTQVAAQLPADEQVGLLERWVAALSPHALQKLEEALHARLGKHPT